MICNIQRVKVVVNCSVLELEKKILEKIWTIFRSIVSRVSESSISFTIIRVADDMTIGRINIWSDPNNTVSAGFNYILFGRIDDKDNERVPEFRNFASKLLKRLKDDRIISDKELDQALFWMDQPISPIELEKKAAKHAELLEKRKEKGFYSRTLFKEKCQVKIECVGEILDRYKDDKRCEKNKFWEQVEIRQTQTKHSLTFGFYINSTSFGFLGKVEALRITDEEAVLSIHTPHDVVNFLEEEEANRLYSTTTSELEALTEYFCQLFDKTEEPVNEISSPDNEINTINQTQYAFYRTGDYWHLVFEDEKGDFENITRIPDHSQIA